MAFYYQRENGSDRYLRENGTDAYLREHQYGPSGGQRLVGAAGSVVKVVSVALVGLTITAAAGLVVPFGEGVAALTGESSTSAAGSLTPSHTRPLLGQSAACEQGLVYGTGRSLLQSALGTTVPAASIPLVGESIASASGLVTPNADGIVPLVGSASITATGTLSAPGSLALTGSESTAEAGTLAPSLRPTDPIGQEVASATGSVSIEANDVTVHITGTDLTAFAGFVDATPVLTGQATTGSAGILAPVTTCDLTGTALSVSQGALTIEQAPSEDTFILSLAGSSAVVASVPLTGSESATAIGTLGLTDDVFQALTGEESLSEAGDTVPTPLLALLGESIASAQQNMGAPGFAALTGSVINGQQGIAFVTNDREQSLTGAASTLALGTIGVNSRPPLAGLLQQTGIGTMGRIGGDMQFALTGSSSTGNTGTLGVIGQDVLPPGVSNEGCSIVSDTAQETETSPAASGAEGCFIQSGTAKEV